LFIVMDNSNSMHETTAGLDMPNPDGGYDLDPAWLTDGGQTADGGSLLSCNLARLQDAGVCFSKLCSAKCVLYNALDKYEQDFEFGFATYNTYKRKVDFSLGSSGCTYDVLAAPNEVLPGVTNPFWSVANNLAPSCGITRGTAASTPGVRQNTTLTGSRYVCDTNPNNLGSDPNKNCTSVATTGAQWYNATAVNNFDQIRNDVTTPSAGAVAATTSTINNTCTGSGGTMVCSAVTNAGIFPGAGGALEPTNTSYNANTYYLRSVQDFPSTVANIDQFYSRPGTANCIAAGEVLGQTTTTTAGPPGAGYNANLTSLVAGTFAGEPTSTASGTSCTAARPCQWTLINKQNVAVGNTTNNAACNANVAPTVGSPPAWTYVNTTTTTSTGASSPVMPTCPATSLTCPGQSAQCSTVPATCAVPAGTVVSAGTNTYAQASYEVGAVTPPVGFTISAATTVNTYDDTAHTFSSAASCTGLTLTFTGTSPVGGINCGSSFTGKCVYGNASAQPVPGDSTQYFCRYTLYKRTFTQPLYACRYTFTQYNFTQVIPNPPVLQCSWKLRQLWWRPQLYRYNWASAGGEYVTSASVTFNPANMVCSTSPVTFPSTSPAQCPAKFASTDPTAPAACRAVAGRECRLRWWSAPTGAPATYATAAYKFGRNSRYSNTSNVTTAVNNYSGASPPYCAALDYGNAPFASAADLPSKPFGVQQVNATASWCSGSGSLGPGQDLMTMGDPYSPTENNYALDTWFGSYRGGTITDTDGDGNKVLYSIDPNLAVWQPTPILSKKLIGWSRLPDGTPMLGLFHDYDPLGLPTLKQFVLRLPMHDNPLQLNYSTGATDWIVGANTPLYGTLTNFKDYLQDTLDTAGTLGPDDLAQCRNYGFVLFTDGDENQTGRQANHPLNTANGPCDPWTLTNCQSPPDFTTGTQLEDLITAIRGVNGGSPARTPKAIKSYMISWGNGATSDLLDRMAQRAGTSINPATGQLDLTPAGQAYKPQSGAQLQAAFDAIAQSFANQRVSRSKPTVVRDSFGAMVYTASYQYSTNSGAREWFGYLDAYDVAALGGGTQTATWNFDQLLNGQASRHVYTYLPLAAQQVDLTGALASSQKDELKAQFGLAAGAATDPQFQAILNTVLNPTLNAPFTFALQTRTAKLAAIVHSTPAVVGPPRGISTWPGNTVEEPAYAAFKTTYLNRESRVFNSSNDGIMHAICEPSNGVPPMCNGLGGRGTEVYGFVPPAIQNRLDDLHNDMVNEYTADGSFGGGDVCFANCAPAVGFGGWFSMLIGSMNRGNNSLFALDVTDANTPVYKWTLTNGMLGETWSPPTVARVTVDMPAAQGGTGAKRWVGLVGAGYSTGNNWGTVSNGFMAVDLETGTVLTDATAAGSCTNAYGATISPCNQGVYRVDINPFACDAYASGASIDGVCTRYRNSVPSRVGVLNGVGAQVKEAYFGDVQGRVSVSRLETPKVADWQPQRLFDPVLCPGDVFGNPNAPIFDATDNLMTNKVDQLPLDEDNEDGVYWQGSNGTREVRSIYQRVLVESMTSGSTWVFAGTGTDARANDDLSYDYLYAIEDSKLTGQTCVGRAAWVKRFPQGEKVLSEMASQAGVLFVSTFVPKSNDPCGDLGDTALYAFYEANGKPALVFNDPNGGTSLVNRVVISGTGIPADTTVIPTGNSTVNILVRTSDPNHRFTPTPASNLVLPGRIKSWRRVR
jgi:hypothetical protein